MTSTFYSRAQGVVVVFDVTIEESFANLSQWIREIREEAPDNCVIALCANKTDSDKSLWRVSKDRFTQFAADEKIPLYEASAATAANVNHVCAVAASFGLMPPSVSVLMCGRSCLSFVTPACVDVCERCLNSYGNSGAARGGGEAAGTGEYYLEWTRRRGPARRIHHTLQAHKQWRRITAARGRGLLLLKRCARASDSLCTFCKYSCL